MLEGRAQRARFVLWEPAGDRVETQLGERRCGQVLPWQGPGFMHPRERIGELAAYASDEVRRRGLLKEGLASGGEEIWLSARTAGAHTRYCMLCPRARKALIWGGNARDACRHRRPPPAGRAA